MATRTNEHIRRGNAAIVAGDLELAKSEFYQALDDPDLLTQKIARNRLMEMFREQVYASTHAHFYHRPHCPAKNWIIGRRLVWYTDWDEAERAGKEPCPQCNPPRIQPHPGGS